MRVTLSFEVETKDDEMAEYADDNHHEFELLPTHADILIKEATDAWREKGLVGSITAAGSDHS